MIDGLKAKYRTAIVDALASNDRVERAVLFGSRATETYTSASDVDIALFGDRLTSIDQARLNGIIDELTIPQRVDLVLYAMIDNDVLRKHIEKHGVEWYRQRGNHETELQGLLPKQKSVLEAILREHLPDTDVWAYGSRVSSPESDGCDLNLVLRARDLQKIPDVRMDSFIRAVCNASFPFPVNAQDWACMSEQFRRELERERTVSINKPDGEAGKAWPMVPLGQVAELTLSSVDKKTKPHEHPVMLCNYMDVYSNQFIRSDLNFMAATATEREIRRCKLQRNDVVITKDSEQYNDIGVPALVRDDIDDLVCGYHLAILRQLPEEIHGFYLFYALQIESVRNQFHSYASGITRFGLRKDDILRVNVPLPPLPEQRVIAGVLGTMDKKIELNRRINETLDVMAEAIFKDWFVDFEPVRANLAGSNAGLPDEIAALFPAKLIGSEIGEIPEGWDVVPLSDIIEVNPTRSLRKDTVAPYLDMAKMPTKGHAPDKSIDRPFGSGMRFINGDTLVARITPCLENGKTAYVDFLKRGQIGWGSTEYIVLCPKPPLPREFAYCLARSNRFREFAIRNMTGTSGRQRVSAKVLTQFVLPSPPEPVCTLFGQLIRPLIARTRVAIDEIQTLATLRDELLPKLVSGKLHIKDTEKFFDTIP